MAEVETWVTPHVKVPALCDDILFQHNTLIGGTVGSGKSVLLNSILYTAHSYAPLEMRIIYIDLKKVELYKWAASPHCLKYCDELDDAIEALKGALRVIDVRYKMMREKGLRKWDGGKLLIVIDELADLLTVGNREVLPLLTRIGQIGRAARVGIIACTQSPSRRTIAAPLQVNFTAALALRCRSAIESRQIIGIAGAEELPEYGKGIYWTSKGICDVNIPLTDDDKQDDIISYWIEQVPKKQDPAPEKPIRSWIYRLIRAAGD